MNVGQMYSRGLVSVPESSSLWDVAALMRERQVGAVVVVARPSDRPVAVGIVTDRDIVHAQLERTAELARLRAADVMSPDPLVVCETDSLVEAIRRMSARGVRRAPVISPDGALVGMISTDDLIGQVAREVGSLARLLEPRRPDA